MATVFDAIFLCTVLNYECFPSMPSHGSSPVQAHGDARSWFEALGLMFSCSEHLTSFEFLSRAASTDFTLWFSHSPCHALGNPDSKSPRMPAGTGELAGDGRPSTKRMSRPRQRRCMQC